MSDELLQACRDIRLLGWVWFGLMVAAGSIAFSYAALYQFGVRFRLPRMRSTIKRLATERNQERVRRVGAEEQCANLRYRLETVGLEAQKELARVDAIRRKTEKSLVEQKDLCASMEGLLLAVNAQQFEPGSPESWVPQTIVVPKSTT